MTRLEDELRATFASRTADAPVVHDRVGSAIARGRAARRRHRVVASAAAFLAVALMATGTWWVHGDRPNPGIVAGPGPSGSTRPPAPGSPWLDLVVGGELRPTDGRVITLPGSGDVYDAARIPEGWLVVRGDKAMHKLWLIRPGGAATLLLNALPSVFAFSGNNVLAYQQGSTITVMTFDFAKGTGFVKAQMYVPGQDGSQGRTGAELVGWVGGSRLVLGNRVGIGYDGFTLMAVTDNQVLAPTYNRAVIGVYAGTPDGRSVVGATREAGTTCAAVLGLAYTLEVQSTECNQPYLSPSRRALSPDGRRILGRVDHGIAIADASNGKVIATVPAAQEMWPADPAWIDDRTIVIPGNGRLLYVAVVDPAHPHVLPAPSTSERWMVVAPPAGG